MDEKDAQILDILKENARTKNTDIARKIGLTEGAVRARISNLTKNGTIKRFTVETESFGVEGIVLIKSDASRSKEVVSKLKALSDMVLETSGEFDAAALVHATDVDYLNSTVDKIRDIDGVVATTTLIRLA